jgi:hypothetical protein
LHAPWRRQLSWADPKFSRAAFETVPSFETTFFRTALIAVAFAILAILRNQKLSIPRVRCRISWHWRQPRESFRSAIWRRPVHSGGSGGDHLFTFPVLILLTAPIARGHAPGWKQIAVGLFALPGWCSPAADFGRLDFRDVHWHGTAALPAPSNSIPDMISRHTTPVVFGSLVHFAILPATLVRAGG